MFGVFRVCDLGLRFRVLGFGFGVLGLRNWVFVVLEVRGLLFAVWD